MKREYFYRYTASPENGLDIQAILVRGWTDGGDIGLAREPEGKEWLATHVPTGMDLYKPIHGKTRKQLLKIIRDLINEKVDFEKNVETHITSEHHKKFLQKIPGEIRFKKLNN